MSDKNSVIQATHSSDDQSLAQVRELLFGEQQRHTGRELGRLEKRLDESDAALGRRLDEIDATLRQANADLAQRLASIEQQQQAALDTLGSELRHLLDQASDRVRMLESDQHETDQRLTNTEAAQQEALQRLRQAAVDRNQLADMLTGIASELRKTDD